MKEYTLLACAGVVAVVLLDTVLRTRLLRKRSFWFFSGIMSAVTTVVNGYLTWRPIVRYGEQYMLGIRLVSIPVEDYLFGFSLITMNIVLWEYCTGRARKHSPRTQADE
jgi:lycopene cyclase domain-containing protein